MKKLINIILSIIVLSSITLTEVNASDDVQAIVDELQALANKSRQERAADRWLQNALEDLVAKYNYPWKTSLLLDDFSDGDYHKGTDWQVGSGDFWVDRRLGLRSRVEPKEVSKQQSEKSSKQTQQEDLGTVLLGAVLEKALSTNENKQSQQTTPEVQLVTTPASIRTKLAIPITFAVESSFSQNNPPNAEGRFEWLVMQGESTENAYKVIVSTGTNPSLELLRTRNGQVSHLETNTIPNLNDSEEHKLSWRQKSDGAIDVFLDGKQVIKTIDRPFRYGYDYLGLINRIGDFSISSIEVFGE